MATQAQQVAGWRAALPAGVRPYTERQLCRAIECVDRHLQGESFKSPKGLELFVESPKEE